MIKINDQRRGERMKMKVFIVLACLATACVCQNRNRPADTRTLQLSDQELRFAGHALHTVFGSNPNAYVSANNYFYSQESLSLFLCCRQLEKSKRKSSVQRHIYDRRRGLRRFGHSNKCRCGAIRWHSESSEWQKYSKSTITLWEWICEKFQVLNWVKKAVFCLKFIFQ